MTKFVRKIKALALGPRASLDDNYTCCIAIFSANLGCEPIYIIEIE